MPIVTCFVSVENIPGIVKICLESTLGTWVSIVSNIKNPFQNKPIDLNVPSLFMAKNQNMISGQKIN